MKHIRISYFTIGAGSAWIHREVGEIPTAEAVGIATMVAVLIGAVVAIDILLSLAHRAEQRAIARNSHWLKEH